MSIPAAIPTVRVTAEYNGPDGRALKGTVTFTGPPLLTFPDSNLFIAGAVVATLNDLGQIVDVDGNIGVRLPATDSPGMNPSDWTYTVKENLIGVLGARTYSMLLPKDTPDNVVDLADVAPADPTTPNYVPVPGPRGADGVVQSVNGINAANITLRTPDIGALSKFTNSARVDLAGTVSDLFVEKNLTYFTVAQAAAVDNLSGHVYVTQLVGDMVQLPGESAPVPYADRDLAGDICINRLTLAGTLVDAMHIKGAGHGAGLGIEYGLDGKTWLWVDRDASGSGFARSLSRIQFAPGTILDSRATTSYAPMTGMHGVSVCTDPYNRRLALRHTWPDPSDTGRRFMVYDLDEAAAGRWVPLATFLQAANANPVTTEGPQVGTFQGHAIYGRYVYTLDGLSTAGSTDNTHLTSIDWASGAQVQRVKVTAHPEFTYREPEAMAVHIPDAGAPHRFRLLYGFANGGTAARNFTLSALDADTYRPARLAVNVASGVAPIASLDVKAASGKPAAWMSGAGGANIAEFWNNGAAVPASWVSSGGHIATIKNIYATGDAVQIGSLTVDVGGGKGVLGLSNAGTVPTGATNAGVVLYAEGGVLKVRQTDGATVTVANTTPAAQYAIKSADTARANQTVPANDPDLALPVVANAVYLVEAVLVWTNGGGGMRVDWTGPAGSTMIYTDNDGSGIQAAGTDNTFAVTTGCTIKGLHRVGATAGTLNMRWAQNTVNATATTLISGCYLTITRVA